MNNRADLYKSYEEITQKAADLGNAAAVLGWDQEVYMPVKGAPFRGRQLATLAAQAHELMTSEAYGNLLYRLLDADGLTGGQQQNVRLSLEDYEKNKKLPSAFIEELTMQTSTCFQAWLQARTENNYTIFSPHLGKMINLKKEQADLYGYEKHPYDALLDDYEKGATVAMLDPVFAMVRQQLPPLLNKISAAGDINDAFLHRHYIKDAQWAFSLDVLNHMGYDFQAGRQDISEHPFTTSFSPADVRITTRIDEHNFASLLWSSIHEGGHALYEQGLPEIEYGMPLGAAASLAVHESQSRLWENCVGRGMPFWHYFYPRLQSCFPGQLSDVPLDVFYKGINKVRPSLVRTEADEVTYHFHVMIRYEIEKNLLTGMLKPADLSHEWNHMYQKYLGIVPGDDKHGVLQDVHWSHGSFGYFPTYSLGSFYAAQFFEAAQEQISGLDAMLEVGDFNMLLQWLRTNIHRHGRRYRSNELCRIVTGRELDFNSFMRYLQHKYKEVYGLK